MRTLFTFLFLVTGSITFSQEVKIDEKSVDFSGSNRNAILVTIPYTTSDLIEKKIKDEMKDWGGKYNSSKGEFMITQGQIKEIGEKMFDGYAKIVSVKDGNVIVAFAFDLGGAFLTSSQHKEQYSTMSSRIKAFGVRAAKEATEDEKSEQEKLLRATQKEQESLEKEKSSLEQEIVDAKKRIEEAQKKIEQNKQDQEKKKEEIKNQSFKVEEVTKKLSAIK